MKLIFIYGLPATGKLTIARELSEITGYKLFHNHLVVDLLLPLFDFGSEPFVKLREEMWLAVFEQTCRIQMPGLIFTFNPETTVRPRFIDDTLDAVTSHNGQVDFVELIAPLSELKLRINSPSRLQYRKLSSLSLFEKLYDDGVFDTSYMPRPRLTVDTSLFSPRDAATHICHSLELGGRHRTVASEV